MESKIQMSLIRKKHKKHRASSYYYKKIGIDDKFSKTLKSYLDEGAVYNFINSMIEGSKYCTDMIKKHFNKELVMTKKMMKILKTLLNVQFVLTFMLRVMLK